MAVRNPFTGGASRASSGCRSTIIRRCAEAISRCSRETCGSWVPRMIKSTPRGCDMLPPLGTRRSHSTVTTWRQTPGYPRCPGWRESMTEESGTSIGPVRTCHGCRSLHSNKSWPELALPSNRSRPRRDAGSQGLGRYRKTRSSMKSIGAPGLDRRPGAVALSAEAGVLSTCLRARDSGIHHLYAQTARALSIGGARSVAASPCDDQLPDRPEPDRQPVHIPSAPARNYRPFRRDPGSTGIGSRDRLGSYAGQYVLRLHPGPGVSPALECRLSDPPGPAVSVDQCQ